MAQAKAKARTNKKNNALPQGGDIPEGFQKIGGGYAPTWQPEIGEALHGVTTSEVKIVQIKRGRKTQDSRCVEVTSEDSGDRFTVWEAAALSELFDKMAEAGEGCEVYIRFEGLGKKKANQNPPKLYTAAIAA